MTYLIWYLGVGAIPIAIIFIANRFEGPSSFDRISDVLIEADPRSGKWWWRPVNYAVIPVLAGVVLWWVWPLAVYEKVKNLMDGSREVRKEVPKEFAVIKAHLLQPRTIDEIEQAERVEDPMGAAPHLPFGHLNQVWEEFKKNVRMEDQLWEFSAPWTADWGRQEIREGYVILREDAINEHFFARWIPQEKADEQ